MLTFIARHGEIRPEVVLASDQIRAVEDPCGRRDERREECVHDEHHHGDEAAVRLERQGLQPHCRCGPPRVAHTRRCLDAAAPAGEQHRVRDATEHSFAHRYQRAELRRQRR